jgi:hypothetical protein
MPDEDSPVAHTKHGDLTLDQIADMMPGMARLMVEISDRFWILYYAARGGNWDLARHEFSEMRKTLRMSAIVRPKYKEAMEAFDAECMVPLQDALKTRDFYDFESHFIRATDRANVYHREFGYDCIEWQLPDEPPLHLRMRGTEEGG